MVESETETDCILHIAVMVCLKFGTLERLWEREARMLGFLLCGAVTAFYSIYIYIYIYSV
jgi:hypothetical protein